MNHGGSNDDAGRCKNEQFLATMLLMQNRSSEDHVTGFHLSIIVVLTVPKLARNRGIAGKHRIHAGTITEKCPGSVRSILEIITLMKLLPVYTYILQEFHQLELLIVI